MENQGSNAELWKAYAAAYAEIGNVVKNANNPHFGNNYADLAAVNGAFKETFAKHGLALYQCPGRLVEAGGKLAVGIVNVLAHGPSGQSFAVETQMPLGDKPTAQSTVAATTYGRRCAAAGIAGLAQVDDDGNEASGRGESRSSKGQKYSGPSDTELLAAINAFTGTAEEMDETLGQQVQDLNDSNVAKVYRAKKRELRGKK